MFSNLRYRLRALFRRNSMEAELDTELRAHIEQQTEKYIKSGMSPEEAARRARIELGGIEQIKEDVRDSWGLRIVSELVQDLRYGLRQLHRNPGFTAVAVFTLALGIGATMAVFSVMYALALKPLPVRQPDQLVEVGRAVQVGDGNSHAYAEWKLFRDSQQIFSDVFAINDIDVHFNIKATHQQQEVSGRYVSGGYFQTLGVPAFIGRVLAPSDDQIDAPPVCVLGYGLWRDLFSQSTSVIGHTVLVNGNEFQIVGVAPRSFFGVTVGSRPEIFMTLGAEQKYTDYQLLYGHQTPSLDSPHELLSIFARLKSEESVGQANAGLQILSPEIYKALPPRSNESTGRSASRAPLMAYPIPNGISVPRQQDMGIVLLLMAMAAVALIIACANLGNLLLARAAKRQEEIATRLALGACRWRLVRQLLAESATLSGAGAAAGLLIASWWERILLWALSWPDMPLHLDLQWDMGLITFAVGVTVACTLLFGLAPAVRATGVSLYSAMKRSPATGKRRDRLSNSALVAVQVALSMAVFICAGLLARTAHALLAVNPGYDPKGVLVGQAKWQAHGGTPRHAEFVGKELLSAFRSLPGITSASWIRESSLTTLPELTVTGPKGTERRRGSYDLFVSPEFFKTREAPILAGRDFNEHDTSESLPVAIVSEDVAKALFGKVNAVGLSFRENYGGPERPSYLVSVVGVAGEIQYRAPNYGPLPMLYRPVSQCGGECSAGVGDYELRVAGSMPAMAERLKNAAAEVDPNILFNSSPLTDAIYSTVHRNRAMAAIAGTFSLFVGLLAMIGVYGVTSYATAERTREIGVRIALGAQPGNVSWTILGETMVPVCIGVVLGVGLSLTIGQMIRGLLWGVGPDDPLSFIIAVCSMLLIAGGAAHLPARRAAKVDPMVALRYE